MAVAATSSVPGSAAWRALGTAVEVHAADSRSLPRVRRLAEEQLNDIDLACSRFRPDSEINRLNQSKGRWVPVSSLFMEALDAGLSAARASSGDVDPTVGRALELIGYDRDFAEVLRGPNPRVRVAATPGWQSIKIDRLNRAVQVPPGVVLDLGATAKAFAADRAARAAAELVDGGVLVNLGGDLAAAGAAPKGGWPVRVTDDHEAGFGAPGQTVSIESGGLATSSTTVRQWRSGAEHLHHIVNPESGLPAEVVWRTVSVAAATCVAANTASTAAIVRGRTAPGWLESSGLPARLVATDGDVVAVGGWPEGGSS